MTEKKPGPNEWLRPFLDGEEPPQVELPSFYAAGTPYDSPVWLADTVVDAIGIPTDVPAALLTQNTGWHIVKQRRSLRLGHRIAQLAPSVLADPTYIGRYDPITQRFAVVGRVAEGTGWLLVAGKLIPGAGLPMMRDRIEIRSAYFVGAKDVTKWANRERMVVYKRSP